MMMLAMMAAMCVTFTACGGDSDDDGTPQVPTGPTGSTEYVDPCLDFGSSQSHVKEYMSAFNWELNENSNEYTLLYSNAGASVVINYMFIGNKFWWKAGDNLVVPINYVHQLQDAMRLAMADKVIEL